MKPVIASMLILLTVPACASDSLGIESPSDVAPPAPVVGNFCAIYKPVYTSVNDTELTKTQVDVNNAVWVEQCEKTKDAR